MKIAKLTLLWLCLALLWPNPTYAGFRSACQDVVAHLLGRRVPLKTGQLTLLVYPFHAELDVDGVVYRSDGKFRSREVDFDDMSTKAQAGGRPFVEIPINVADPELLSMIDYLNRNYKLPTRDTCISGLCRLINDHLGLYIPPGVRWSPELTLTYLYLLKMSHLDHGRLGALRFHGGGNALYYYGRSVAFQGALLALLALIPTATYYGGKYLLTTPARADYGPRPIADIPAKRETTEAFVH